MTTLRPMAEPEYAEFAAQAIPAYAADKVASGQWAAEVALELSRKEHEELLPQGLRTPDNHQTDFTLPSRSLEPTTAASGDKAVSTQFAVEPFWDLLLEAGWTFKPGWHVSVRSTLSLTSFHLPIQRTANEESIVDPLAFATYSAPGTYDDADIARGIRLLRVQASVGKSFPF
mgnify:CR=1 FL=1